MNADEVFLRSDLTENADFADKKRISIPISRNDFQSLTISHACMT
jgi:hypothetical protein